MTGNGPKPSCARALRHDSHLCRIIAAVPSTFTLNCCSSCPAVIASSGPKTPYPALFTRTSIAPKRATANP